MASKNEWQENQRDHKETTDKDLGESTDIKDDSEQIASDWNEQSDPALIETADALTSIADALEKDISDTHEGQSEQVESDIDAQKQDISDPARENEQSERESADALSQTNDNRFFDKIEEAVDQRKDAEEFLKEIADTDEHDQEEAQDTLTDHRQAVDNAIQNIKDF